MIVRSLKMWLPLQGARLGTVQEAEEPSAHTQSPTPGRNKERFFIQHTQIKPSLLHHNTPNSTI